MTITEQPVSERVSSFIIEPLAPGYGMTIGHSLRRVLLTSLEGAAVAYVKITGADHEFTTLKGMKEDIVELILNLKSLRVHSESSEPVVIHLEKKGPGVVTASDFTPNSDITISDPDHQLATLDKNGKLSMDVTIEQGRGYVPTERKGNDKLPLGTIAIDSIFSPIKRVHYEVEHTRVGGQTDYDKLMLELTTDGTITPADAMARAAQILVEHFGIVRDAAQAAGQQSADQSADKKPAKKRSKKAVATEEVAE
jgi:DNA-directed RNA polymerase subunit alpha